MGWKMDYLKGVRGRFGIFIPVNVPSLKNGKSAFIVGGKFKKRRAVMVSSELVREYEKRLEWNYVQGGKLFKKSLFGGGDQEVGRGPVYVGFFFVRDSRRRFDYINALQLVQDMMVRHGWLADDNMECLVPVIDGWELGSKEEAGVYIRPIGYELRGGDILDWGDIEECLKIENRINEKRKSQSGGVQVGRSGKGKVSNERQVLDKARG